MDISRSEPFNMAQCVREVYVLMLSSLRDRARTAEKWRELGDRQLDELTNEKVRALRAVAPQIMRVASIVLGVASIGTGLCPEAVRHSYEWLSRKIPALPTAFMQELFAPGGKGYAGLSELVGGKLGIAQTIAKTGTEIYDASERSTQARVDANIEKAKRLSEQRTKESSDRRNESTEVLRLIQQIDSQTAEAVRGMAR